MVGYTNYTLTNRVLFPRKTHWALKIDDKSNYDFHHWKNLKLLSPASSKNLLISKIIS